uniref:Reverse transcriptase domain-containing protein n=1 Tax=Octopus bimaculoides TaxID=37653 RepID=A0A0L8HZH3_OCTBM
MNKANLLSDKQYGFQSSSSIFDIFTFITYRVNSALDHKFGFRVFTLHISKVFDKVCHRELLHILTSCDISSGSLFHQQVSNVMTSYI